MPKETGRSHEYAHSCDWKSPQNKDRAAEQQSSRATVSKIYRHKENFRWSGVKTEKYKQKEGGQKDGWSAISRLVLTGSHGETSKFHLRYFEIAPKGYSSLERHRHEHVVICIRGKGKVRMGKRSYTLNYLDTAYIAPDTVHQLTNPYNEPFGFFCIVNAKRDKPKIVMRNE